MVVPLRSVKERRAHLFFQLLHADTDRWLSAADARGGSANTSLLHHCREHFKLLEFHGPSSAQQAVSKEKGRHRLDFR